MSTSIGSPALEEGDEPTREVGDAAEGSNAEPMAHLAFPLRSSAGTRRIARSGQRGVRRLAGLGLMLLVLGGSYLWLRDSRLVAVREVVVTGVSSSQEARVRQALRGAALDMTTLHVRMGELRAVVAPYASVADLRAETDFPHTLRIEVVERAPAALLISGDQAVPVSAGGLLLRGLRPSEATPVIEMGQLPVGTRLRDRRTQAAVDVLAGAPAELRGRIERARTGSRGLQLELHDGPDLIFGSTGRLEAKWAAATRVLADSRAQGATYLDLRMPEWTAAGGLGPVEDEADSSPGDATPSDPAAAPANPQP